MGMGFSDPGLLGNRFRPCRWYSKLLWADIRRCRILHSAIHVYLPSHAIGGLLDKEACTAGGRRL